MIKSKENGWLVLRSGGFAIRLKIKWEHWEYWKVWEHWETPFWRICNPTVENIRIYNPLNTFLVGLQILMTNTPGLQIQTNGKICGICG